MKKTDSLNKVAAEVSSCKKCKLYLGRTHAVPGEGNPKAKIFFIGEGPGKNEDREGRPFVGAAGKLLNKMILSIDLKRNDVFIGNVVKCRPPMNRDPEPEEMKICSQYLYRQIKLIKPKLIVSLGRFSLGFFLPQESISKSHGQLKKINFNNSKHPLHSLSPIYLYPLFHPAAALYRGSVKEILFDDFKKIPSILKQLK